MKPRPPFCFLPIAAALLLPTVLHAEPTPLPTDEQVRELLRQRIDVEKRGVSIVVGLIDAQGTRVIPSGRTAREGGSAVNGKTMYEIGSVTKLFTSLLLADMAARGEVKLDDPVAKYLPKEVKVPTRNDKEITLLDLATHRSGLPSFPDNLNPKDERYPAADYTVAQMYAFLSGYALTRDIGSKVAYSNLGVGLLGHALALRAGKSYEDLVVDRVCRPLAMADTRITLDADQLARLAKPYDETLAPMKNEELPTLAGAGAIRSDVEDLLKFMKAEMGLAKTPLSGAMQETQRTRAAINKMMDIALGWHILKQEEPPVWWHNGATAGYHCFVGFRPATKTGVVVLTDTAMDIDDLALHLLDSRFPLTPPPKPHIAVEIKPELADRYVGRYQLAPNFVLTFSREGGRYFLVATDQPKNEVFPESETDFFLKEIDARIAFVKDAEGKWSSLVLRQSGVPDQPAKRLP